MTARILAVLRRRTDLVVLLAVVLGIGGANLFWSDHLAGGQHAQQVQQQAAQHAEQVRAQRQAVIVEDRLCTSLDRIAALTPPAGDPVTNPARGYDQQLHKVLSQLGPDVGCAR